MKKIQKKKKIRPCARRSKITHTKNMTNKMKSHTKVSNKPSNDKFTTTTKLHCVNKNTTSNKITKINNNTLFARSKPKINTLK